MLFFETIKPVADGAWWNGESSRFDLTGATNPATCPRPRKKRQDRSRCAACVAKIEVVRSWVVEINGTLNETQSKKPDIEIQIALRIARNRSNMMKSGDE